MKNFLTLLFFTLISYNAFSQFDPAQKQYIGNLNELVNPSFAQGTVGWTATGTGVSFTVGATNAITSNSYAATVTFSASPTTASFGQTITSTSPISQQYAGLYASTTATTLNIGIKVNGVLTNSVALASDGIPHFYEIPYIGTTNRELIIYPTATTTATVGVSWATNGVAGRLTQDVSGAQFFGSVIVNSGCSGAWSTNSTSFVSFGVVTGCTYTVAGNASAPSTIIPAIKFASMPAGDYQFVYSGYALNNTSAKSFYLRMSNGTYVGDSMGFVGAALANLSGNGYSERFTITSPLSNTTFELQGKVDSGSTMSLYNAADYPLKIMVYYFPPKSKIYSEPCTSDIACANEFSAKISSTGTVSGENLDWINGNASISGTSIYTLTFNANVFGIAPTCVTEALNSTNTISTQEYTTATTGGGAWYSARTDSTAATATNWKIICTRSDTDYKARRVIVGSFQNVATTSNITSPKIASSFVGTTGTVSLDHGDMLNGNCTNASPMVCSFNSGYWTVAPNCTTSMSPTSSVGGYCEIQNITTSSFGLYCQNDAGSNLTTSREKTVICHGY